MEHIETSNNGPKKAMTRCNKILIVAGIILIFSAIGSYFFSQILIKQKIHDVCNCFYLL